MTRRSRSPRSILQRFPDEPEAFYEQASAYDALGRQEEAITSYEQARMADPLNPTICNDLAETYLAAGRTKDAVEMAETAVSLDPEMAIAYETLAQSVGRGWTQGRGRGGDAAGGGAACR